MYANMQIVAPLCTKQEIIRFKKVLLLLGFAYHHSGDD